jgi:hypothetical protein
VSALLVLFGVADLTDHTPQSPRQVPQRLAGDLNHQPGRLGFIWAVDLGLLVTTQKTTSLLWIGLTGAVLLGPSALVIPTLGVIAGLYWLGTAVLIRTGDSFLAEPARVSRLGGWATIGRRIAGVAGLGLAATVVVALI